LILFIDDDHARLDGLTSELKYNGIECWPAGSVKEAIEALATMENQCRLAIVDIMLSLGGYVDPGGSIARYGSPPRSGLWLADHIRNHYPHIKIVFYSGLLRPDVARPPLTGAEVESAMGQSPYFTKRDTSLHQLAGHVMRLLEEP
jgi:CheY-like chemotaxis protein